MVRPFLLLAAGAMLASQAAFAAQQWGGSVMLASNHLQRGVSRSSNDAAVSAEVHVQSADLWFAGVWTSTSRVRRAEPTTVELAATIGLGTSLGADWVMRGSYSHYETPWQDPDYYRYDELMVDLRWREALLLSVTWSPDISRFAPGFGARDGHTQAYEVTYQHRLRGGFRAWAGGGYHDLSDLFGDGYWYGSAGAGWGRGPWQLDVSYVHPDDTARRLSAPGIARRRALAQVSFTF
jgi:uncharacterized protein (TIGR02001 family)